MCTGNPDKKNPLLQAGAGTKVPGEALAAEKY